MEIEPRLVLFRVAEGAPRREEGARRLKTSQRRACVRGSAPSAAALGIERKACIRPVGSTSAGDVCRAAARLLDEISGKSAGFHSREEANLIFFGGQRQQSPSAVTTPSTRAH